MIAISGPYPPAILPKLDGKVYVVSGGPWVEVPDGTTLDDLEWHPTFEQKVVEKPQEFHGLTWSSDGKKMYHLVITTDGASSCECTGFFYRRNCRHLDEYRTQLKLEGKLA